MGRTVAEADADGCTVDVELVVGGAEKEVVGGALVGGALDVGTATPAQADSANTASNVAARSRSMVVHLPERAPVTGRILT